MIYELHEDYWRSAQQDNNCIFHKYNWKVDANLLFLWSAEITNVKWILSILSERHTENEFHNNS